VTHEEVTKEALGGALTQKQNYVHHHWAPQKEQSAILITRYLL
jgi:propionyl-CoA carboxylase beta chain